MLMSIKINRIKGEVERLATLGFSKNEIAKELNMKPCTFYSWIRKYEELENAYNKGIKKRKEACKTVNIDDELYKLAEVLTNELVETYGEKRVDREYFTGLNFGYLKSYFENIK